MNDKFDYIVTIDEETGKEIKVPNISNMSMSEEEMRNYYRAVGFRWEDDYLTDEEIDQLSIPFLIKKLRNQYGYSQRKMAELMDTNNSTVARLEKGEIKKPTVFLLRKLSRVMYPDVPDLMRICGYNEGDIKFVEKNNPDYFSDEIGIEDLPVNEYRTKAVKSILLHELFTEDALENNKFYQSQEDATKRAIKKLMMHMVEQNEKYYKYIEEELVRYNRLVEGTDQVKFNVKFDD